MGVYREDQQPHNVAMGAVFDKWLELSKKRRETWGQVKHLRDELDKAKRRYDALDHLMTQCVEAAQGIEPGTIFVSPEIKDDE